MRVGDSARELHIVVLNTSSRFLEVEREGVVCERDMEIETHQVTKLLICASTWSHVSRADIYPILYMQLYMQHLLSIHVQGFIKL